MAHQRIWLEKKDFILWRILDDFFFKVLESGDAWEAGCLEAFDTVVKMDGKNLLGITYDQAMDILKQSGDVVELEVLKFDPTKKEKRNKGGRSNNQQPPLPRTTGMAAADEQEAELTAPVPLEPTYLADTRQILKLIFIVSLVLTVIMISIPTTDKQNEQELHKLLELLIMEDARVYAESN